MDEHPRISSQRRFIERRAEELVERLPFMEDEELRWTVRLFQDCLSDVAQREMLHDYSEYLDLHQMRQVVEEFIPRYTIHALHALDAKQSTTGQCLRDLTDEELQGMSAAEKWDLYQRDPAALEPYQVRRELARLFMCLNFDLFHDTALGEAAIEFNAYLDLVDRLGGLADRAIETVKEEAIAAFRDLNFRDVSAVEEVLTTLREAIGRSVGLHPPFDHLLRERMGHWPSTAPDALPEVLNPAVTAAVEEMNLQQLQTSLRVLLELLSLQDQHRELAPLQATYRAVTDIPADVLTTFLPQLSMRIGNRTVCDFALRYRAGRLWAREPVNPQAWKLLPFQEKFMLLEADNEAMDLLQASRHLTRLLLTERYDLLFDPAHQVALTIEPMYQRVLNYSMTQLGDMEQLQKVNRHVTRMMLELEDLVPEADRARRFLEVQEVIGKILKVEPRPAE
jgi:hypothetical protein